jgi:integrase
MPRSGVWFRTDRQKWYATVGGKQYPLGPFGPGDRAGALAALKNLLKQIQPDGPDLLVRDAVAAFIADRTPRVAAVTLAGYRWYLGEFAAKWGTVPVGKLDPRDVETDALGRAWGPDSKRNYLCAAEGVMRFAGRPVRFEKPARGSAGAKAVVPKRVYHMAVGAARGDLRALLEVLWATGARPSEVSGLTAEQIDWHNSSASLSVHKTARKGKPRVLFFPAPALAVLRKQRERHGAGLLFRNRHGRRWGCKPLTQAVWRLGKRVGHPLTLYGFRHAYATDALSAGVPDTHVAALLGHSGTAMLHKHYSHVNQNSKLLKGAAERVRGSDPAA